MAADRQKHNRTRNPLLLHCNRLCTNFKGCHNAPMAAIIDHAVVAAGLGVLTSTMLSACANCDVRHKLRGKFTASYQTWI
eukprot:scaffold266507_cov19-Prasinocladus_malaysianus.AAC.1